MRVFTSRPQRYIRVPYYITQLRRNQWLKEEELVRIQEKRLRAIINHAYRNVPFYYEMFNSVGIKPEEIKGTENLRKIPIITKKEIQRNYPDKIIAKGVDKNRCRIASTSGSTGEPLKICFGQKSTDYSQALLYYTLSECGLRLTDKLVQISFPSKPDQYTWLRRLGLLRKERVSILQPIGAIIDELKKIKPDIIYAYPSILLLLAKEIEEKDISGISPRVIITYGETLTDYPRRKICNSFNAEIYDTYGAIEFVILAFECKEHSGYHLINDSAIIEFIKEGENVDAGELGEIVVTGLYNYEMPLIRYKLGDIGIPSSEKCDCGRGFPLMVSVEGRTDDFLILPSGRTISPRAINVIEYIPGIARYRTIQEEKDRFVVQLVKGKGFSERTISQIKQQIKVGCLGEDVKVEVELMEEIPKERSGKLRTVVSKVRG